MKTAILGAGNTGQIMAFDLAQKGLEVRLYSRSREKAAFLAANGITAGGKLQGHVGLSLVTNDIRKAVDGAHYIFVMTTAEGHRPVAKALRPVIRDGQTIIVFNANWGAFEMWQELSPQHMRPGQAGAPHVRIGETGAQLYIGSVQEPGKVFCKQIKQHVQVAMLRKEDTGAVLRELAFLYPQFTPAGSVLETSLGNSNPTIHASIVLFNLARVEEGEDFLFYVQGSTRGAVRYVEKTDAERLAVAGALGVPATGVLDILNSFWPEKKTDLFELLRENPSYKLARGPKSLNHRYITEDIPFGVVPLIKLGRDLGVPTPYLDTLAAAYEAYLGKDLVEPGFTPDVAALRRLL